MKIVIEGAGEVGSHLAKLFRAESNDVTVIDSDSRRLENLSAYADVETMAGSPTSIDLLRRAGVGDADLFIAVFPSRTQEMNIVSAIIAHHLGAGKVLARVNDRDCVTPENVQIFKEMGIEMLFYPERMVAAEIADSLRNACSTDCLDFERGKLRILSFRISEQSSMLDISLQDFIKTLPEGESEKFRIIALRRGEATIIPDLNTRFLFGDLVFVTTTKEGVGLLSEHFGRFEARVRSVMIAGGGETASMVAELLSRSMDSVKIVERDRERCLELSEMLGEKVSVVCGDARNSDFLCDESINTFDAFVSLMGSDESNVLACVAAKKFGVMRTVAEVENMEYLQLAEEMGVDTVINRKLTTAGSIYRFTLGGRARVVKYMPGTNAQVIEYTAADGSPVTKGALKDINFPKGAVIGGIVRGPESLLAVGSTVIEPYDRVVIFALPETVREIDRFFKA